MIVTITSWAAYYCVLLAGLWECYKYLCKKGSENQENEVEASK